MSSKTRILCLLARKEYCLSQQSDIKKYHIFYTLCEIFHKVKSDFFTCQNTYLRAINATPSWYARGPLKQKKKA